MPVRIHQIIRLGRDPDQDPDREAGHLDVKVGLVTRLAHQPMKRRLLSVNKTIKGVILVEYHNKFTFQKPVKT